MVQQVHNWGDREKKKHLALALQKNPLKWLRAKNVTADTTWGTFKTGFLKTFDKTRFELDLEVESRKMMASKDTSGYVFMYSVMWQ